MQITCLFYRLAFTIKYQIDCVHIIQIISFSIQQQQQQQNVNGRYVKTQNLGHFKQTVYFKSSKVPKCEDALKIRIIEFHH